MTSTDIAGGTAQRWVHPSRKSHLRGLQHEPTRTAEERKVELNGDVTIAEVEADILRTAEPAWQWAHVLAAEPKPAHAAANA